MMLQFQNLSVIPHLSSQSWESSQGAHTSGEVVRCRLHACNSLVKLRVSTELSAQDAVLEARGVLQVNVQLTVHAVLGDGNTGANGSHEAVENEGEAGMKTYVSSLNH